MRALIQRVSRAQASLKGSSTKTIESIHSGLLVLVGFEPSDTPVSIDQMIQKMKSLRVFSDSQGKLNLSPADVKSEYLLVSQFTLYAECKYGNRPSFDGAANKVQAKELFDYFVTSFRKGMGNDYVKNTPFASDLLVELVNDGPVTLWLDSKEIL